MTSYLEILQSDHILVQLTPYAGGKRSELTSQPKCFMVDCGLRNQLINNTAPFDERIDRGALLESWVFSEIWKARDDRSSVHFWRSTSGAEVDFVIDRGTLTAIEVKSQMLRRPKIARSTRSFIQAYEPQLVLIVNTGLDHVEMMGNTKVVWTQPARLPRYLADPTQDITSA